MVFYHSSKLFVCSATAFMILITGTYNVTGADGQQVFTGLANITAGTGFTQAAMEQVLPGFGSMFVAVALFFFAFTTVIAYYYIAETNVAYLTRNLRSEALIFALRVALIASALYGSYISASADIGWGWLPRAASTCSAASMPVSAKKKSRK